MRSGFESNQYSRLSLGYAGGTRPLFWWLGLAVFVATGAWNIGIIAMDDYFDVIAHVIPAQAHSVEQILSVGGFRSPIPRLVLLGFSKFALALGIEEPAGQMRFMLTLWAAFTFIVLSHYMVKLFQLNPHRPARQSTIALCLLSFFFVCPLLLTRPMIESLCAPFLLASCYYACAYAKSERFGLLLASLGLLVIASLFRFQAAVCFLALIVVVILRMRWRDLFLLCLAGVGAFVATGYLDQMLRGEFHQTLRAYIDYNYHHSSKHGVTPFYTYLLLFIGLTLPPAFISRFRGLQIANQFRGLSALLLYFGIFLLVHSLVPHKEERFMVPVLPLFLAILTPFAHYLWVEHVSRWRRTYFLALNAILLVLTIINVPQHNVIGLAQYVQKNPSINSVIDVDQSLVLFPDAFINREINRKAVAVGDLQKHLPIQCDEVIAIRKGFSERLGELREGLMRTGEFSPGVLEALVVKLNPKQNARRSAIELYTSTYCIPPPTG